MSVYDDAHMLAEAGQAVLPVAGKRPLTKHGVHDATRNHTQIENWERELPDATGIAIACGEPSGGLVVADIEAKKLPQACLRGRLRQPKTAKVLTGSGGFHWLSTSTHKFKTVYTAWGELRGDGSYVLAPPSIHPDTGNPYRWLTPLDEGLLPLEDLTAYLPDVEQHLENPKTQEDPEWTQLSSLVRSTSLEAALQSGEWALVGRSEPLAEGFCRLLDLPPIDRHFRCVLPGCESASSEHAVLWPAPNGMAYRCYSSQIDKQEKQGRSLPLAAVYAAVRTGHLRELSKNQLAFWTTRLALDAGLVDKPAIELPELPAGLPANAYKLREAVEGVFAAHAVNGGLRPVPLASGFLAEQSGLAKTTVGRLKGHLLMHRVIVPSTAYRTRYDKRGAASGRLYLPGGAS